MPRKFLSLLVITCHFLFYTQTKALPDLPNLSSIDLFEHVLSSDEIHLVLVQSKHGTNKNVSCGYKIERALQKLTTKPSNIYQVSTVQTTDIVQNQRKQDVEFGALLSQSLTEGIPCLLVWQWGLKSIHSPIPLSASTLARLVKKRNHRGIKKHLSLTLNSFVPMASSLKTFKGQKKLKRSNAWMSKRSKTIKVLFHDNDRRHLEPPPWYKRLSLLYDSRVRFGWRKPRSTKKSKTKTKNSTVSIRWNLNVSAINLHPEVLEQELQKQVQDVVVPRIRTRKEFEALCSKSCVLGLFEFGTYRGGNEVATLRKLASKRFARVAYGEHGLSDMLVENTPIRFGWVMASQQERFLMDLNVFQTPCLISINSMKKIYTVHQNRMPMNMNKMYAFIRRLLSGQHQVTQWTGVGSFASLIDVEHESKEPNEIPVWYSREL
jgi:hypothetical protein